MSFFTKCKDEIKIELSLKKIIKFKGIMVQICDFFLFVFYGFKSKKVGREKNNS